MTHDLFSSASSTPVLMVRERPGLYREAGEVEVLQAAARVLLERDLVGKQVFDAPQRIKEFLLLSLSGLQHEVFSVLFLDAQNALIEYSEMFRGTLTQTSVYPREIVKAALLKNAAAVVLVHNHPSGAAEPSRADEFLTQTLKSALALVDCRVLDHMIVGRSTVVSFAERGLL